MVSVSQNKVRLERMLDYRGVGLERFHCMYFKLIDSLEIKLNARVHANTYYSIQVCTYMCMEYCIRDITFFPILLYIIIINKVQYKVFTIIKHYIIQALLSAIHLWC